MGMLLAQSGLLADAAGWHLRAVSIDLRLGVPQSSVDICALNELRRSLGVDEFATIVGDQLDEENRANLIAHLDRLDGETGGTEEGRTQGGLDGASFS